MKNSRHPTWATQLGALVFVVSVFGVIGGLLANLFGSDDPIRMALYCSAGAAAILAPLMLTGEYLMRNKKSTSPGQD